MNFLIDCFKGILIGGGAILPGISSGVICIIFDLYEKILDSILHFFNDIKKNFKFLFPLVLGGLIGIFLFGNLLNFIFKKYPIQTNSLFMGFILGCIPALVKKIHKNNNFYWKYIPFLLLALSIGVISVFLEKKAFNPFDISFGLNTSSYLYLCICGFCMSAGIIIPGVSSTVILILLGVYQIYLSAISTLSFSILIPIGIGVLFGCFIFMIITKFLLSNFYIPTFYTIIGFTVGSTFVLFPTLNSIFDIILFLCCIILGFLISSNVEKT